MAAQYWTVYLFNWPYKVSYCAYCQFGRVESLACNLATCRNAAISRRKNLLAASLNFSQNTFLDQTVGCDYYCLILDAVCLVCCFCHSLCLLCLVVSAYLWCLWNERDVLCAQDTQSVCLCVFLSDCALLKSLSLDFFCLESVGLKGLLKGNLQNLRMTACHKHFCPHICRSLVATLPETVGAVCFGKICDLQ